MRKQLHAQMDLFAPPIQPADMRGVDRQKAVALLRALLMEAATKVATPPQSNGGKVTNNDLVATMLERRDFKGCRRKTLPISVSRADHALQASFERQTAHSSPAPSGYKLARI